MTTTAQSLSQCAVQSFTLILVEQLKLKEDLKKGRLQLYGKNTQHLEIKYLDNHLKNTQYCIIG